MHDYRKFKVSVNGRIGRTARLSERLRRYVTSNPPSSATARRATPTMPPTGPHSCTPWAKRLGVICGILLGRSFRNKSSKDMAFPHPQSRKDHYWKEDKPSWERIVWKFFKRTINITDYRNGKDNVNPAKNRTFGGFSHDWCDPPRFTTFEPPGAASWAFQYRTAWRTPRSAAASRRTSSPRHQRCGRWEFR